MERRFRLSGLIKFSDDKFTFEKKQHAEEALKKIEVEIGGCNLLGDVELVEKRIDDLGLGHWASDDSWDWVPAKDKG